VLLDALWLILSTPLVRVSVPRHLLACSQVHIYFLQILVLIQNSLLGLFKQKQMCHTQITKETKKIHLFRHEPQNNMNLYTNISTGNITNIALETHERKIILMLKFHFVFYRSVKHFRDM
jgi:hypothetical protein